MLVKTKREFLANGYTYLPGMKLDLAATLAESWLARGFVERVVEEPKPAKRKVPKGKKAS